MQLAAALKAEKLILMTDVPGVLKDKDDIATKYVELDIRTTRQLVPRLRPALHLAPCPERPHAPTTTGR